MTPNESAVLAMMGEPYLNPEKKATVAAKYLEMPLSLVYKNLYSAQKKLGQ